MQITLGRNRVLQSLADSPLVPFVKHHKETEGLVVLLVSSSLAWALMGASVASAAIVATGMIDLSNNNGPGAAAAIAAPGVQAVEAKATEGLGFRDPDYPIFRTAAAKRHRVFGGYLFLHPDESGKAQADYFLAYAHPKKGDLEPVVDSETGGACASGPQTLAALKTLKAHGYNPILYSNTSWLEQFARCEPGLKHYRIWEAEYGPTLTLIPGFHVIAWQFTDAAYKAGFSVDGSRLLVRSVKQLEIAPPAKKLTPAQKAAKAKAAADKKAAAELSARKAHLEMLTGFFAWYEWRHAVSRWKGLRPSERDARPHVRRHIPKKWWRRNDRMVAAHR